MLRDGIALQQMGRRSSVPTLANRIALSPLPR